LTIFCCSFDEQQQKYFWNVSYFMLYIVLIIIKYWKPFQSAALHDFPL